MNILTADFLSHSLRTLGSWTSLFDVLLVALVIYNLLLLIRGTRAVQVLIGIMVLVGLYYVSGVFGLAALETTLEKFFIFLPVAVIVLFQNEIRRALANFGRTSWWDFGHEEEVATALQEVVLASTTLAERKVGALIVIERLEGLRNYIENGVRLDAVVSVDLLVSLFSPDTPTHDGAAIIQRDRIAAATCFLPLSRNSELSREYGTRHRAGLGITEETDALAVIVSEETGGISVAFGGTMTSHLEAKDLRNLLFKYLISDVDAQGLGREVPARVLSEREKVSTV